MQTRQQSLIHNQTEGSCPFSHEKTIDRIGRILNKHNIHNIRTIFKSSKKIKQIFKNPKDQRPQLRRSIPNTLFLRTSIHWRNRKNSQPIDRRINVMSG